MQALLNDKGYIFMDLEFDSEKEYTEILSIGAIRCDNDFNIIDNFYSLVRLSVREYINPYVKEMTNITEEKLQTAKSLKDVIFEFNKWVNKGEVRSIYVWGDADRDVLLKSLKYHGYYSEYRRLVESIVDIQRITSRKLIGFNSKKQLSLDTMKKVLGIDGEVMHHGLYDAIDLFKVFSKCVNGEYDISSVDKIISDMSLKKATKFDYPKINNKYSVTGYVAKMDSVNREKLNDIKEIDPSDMDEGDMDILLSSINQKLKCPDDSYSFGLKQIGGSIFVEPTIYSEPTLFDEASCRIYIDLEKRLGINIDSNNNISRKISFLSKDENYIEDKGIIKLLEKLCKSGNDATWQLNLKNKEECKLFVEILEDLSKSNRSNSVVIENTNGKDFWLRCKEMECIGIKHIHIGSNYKVNIFNDEDYFNIKIGTCSSINSLIRISKTSENIEHIEMFVREVFDLKKLSSIKKISNKSIRNVLKSDKYIMHCNGEKLSQSIKTLLSNTENPYEIKQNKKNMYIQFKTDKPIYLSKDNLTLECTIFINGKSIGMNVKDGPFKKTFWVDFLDKELKLKLKKIVLEKFSKKNEFVESMSKGMFEYIEKLQLENSLISKNDSLYLDVMNSYFRIRKVLDESVDLSLELKKENVLIGLKQIKNKLTVCIYSKDSGEIFYSNKVSLSKARNNLVRDIIDKYGIEKNKPWI